MKNIILSLALLGLTSAGQIGNLRERLARDRRNIHDFNSKAAVDIKKLEKFLQDHQALFPDAKKVVADLTAQQKNVTAILDDGIDIIRDSVIKSQLSALDDDQFNLFDNLKTKLAADKAHLHDLNNKAKADTQKLEKYLQEHSALFSDTKKAVNDGFDIIRDAVIKGTAQAADDDEFALLNKDNIRDLLKKGKASFQKLIKYIQEHQNLFPDAKKLIADLTAKEKNPAAIADDTINILRDAIIKSGQISAADEQLNIISDLKAKLAADRARIRELFAKGKVNIQKLIKYIQEHQNLFPDAKKLVADLSAKEKNPAAIIDDSIDILRDAVIKSQVSAADDEQLNLISDLKAKLAADRARIRELFAKGKVNIQKLIKYIQEHQNLFPDAKKLVADLLAKEKNPAAIIDDSIDILRDAVIKSQVSAADDEQLNLISDLKAKLAADRARIRELFAKGKVNIQKLIKYIQEHQNLFPDAKKLVADLSAKEKNPAAIIDDSIDILKDAVIKSQLVAADNELWFEDPFGGIIETESDSFSTSQVNIMESLMKYIASHPQLISSVQKAYADVMAQNKDVGTIINDGIDIFRDATNIKYFENHPNLIPIIQKTILDLTAKNKDVSAITSDAIKIFQEVFSKKEDYLLGDELNELEEELNFDKIIKYVQTHQQLFPDIKKIVDDSTAPKKNVTAIIDDSIDIFRDAFSDNQMNAGFDKFLKYIQDHQDLFPDIKQLVGDATAPKKNVTAIVDDSIDIIRDALIKKSTGGFLEIIDN